MLSNILSLVSLSFDGYAENATCLYISFFFLKKNKNHVSLFFPIVFKWLKCVHIGLLLLFSE